mgnify:FL=1
MSNPLFLEGNHKRLKFLYINVIGGYGAKDSAFIHPTNNIQQKGDENGREKITSLHIAKGRYLHR